MSTLKTIHIAKSHSNQPHKPKLANNQITNIKADEIYLIALAIEIPPAELLEIVCGYLKINDSQE